MLEDEWDDRFCKHIKQKEWMIAWLSVLKKLKGKFLNKNVAYAMKWFQLIECMDTWEFVCGMGEVQ